MTLPILILCLGLHQNDFVPTTVLDSSTHCAGETGQSHNLNDAGGMEHSSPLAAMQPPSMMLRHHFRAEGTGGCSSFSSIRKFGPESFNFKELSMKTGHPDYFSVKPLRGSSPSVSLAADLSQNFHIDQRYVGKLYKHLAGHCVWC